MASFEAECHVCIIHTEIFYEGVITFSLCLQQFSRCLLRKTLFLASRGRGARLLLAVRKGDAARVPGQAFNVARGRRHPAHLCICKTSILSRTKSSSSLTNTFAKLKKKKIFFRKDEKRRQSHTHRHTHTSVGETIYRRTKTNTLPPDVKIRVLRQEKYFTYCNLQVQEKG